MKRKISLILFFLSFSVAIMADPPDPNGGNGNGGGALPGGGAPIGGGAILLIALAGVYGTKKAISFTQSEEIQ